MLELDFDDDLVRDFDDDLVRGLHRYVHLVGEALGTHGEGSYVQGSGPASAYIALDGRLRHFPDRDVALLWDENQGWSAAVETHSGEDLLMVASFEQDLVPAPEAVAAWARSLFDQSLSDSRHHADHFGHISRRPRASADKIRHRLVAYLRPASTTTVRAETSRL